MCDAWCNMAARIQRAICAPRARGLARMRSSAARSSLGTDEAGSRATVFETTPASPTDRHRSIKELVLRRERLREEHRQRIRARRRASRRGRRPTFVADGARERVVRVRISASRFCRKPSLRVPGALAQCLAVGAVFGRDRVRRVILLFRLPPECFSSPPPPPRASRARRPPPPRARGLVRRNRRNRGIARGDRKKEARVSLA